MLVSNAGLKQTKQTHEDFHHSAKTEFHNNGVTIISGKNLSSGIDGNTSFKRFSTYWNDLEPDQYMNDEGVYRQRRFGCFRYNSDSSTLSLVKNKTGFFQSHEINELNGGRSRKFAPVSELFAKDNILNDVVNQCLKIVPVKKAQLESLTINTHLIRIICDSKIVGLPTPEGIHRDGHCFVSQHLINRSNVYGGVSGIYNSKNEPLVHYQLSRFMDTILVNDLIVKHDVSPVYSADKINEGFRDMLIIDYNFS